MIDESKLEQGKFKSSRVQTCVVGKITKTKLSGKLNWQVGGSLVKVLEAAAPPRPDIPGHSGRVCLTRAVEQQQSHHRIISRTKFWFFGEGPGGGRATEARHSLT